MLDNISSTKVNKKIFLESFESQFHAKCYVVIYSFFMPFSIHDLFHGKYNNFIKRYFEFCEKTQSPVFNNIDGIAEYLTTNCKKIIYAKEIVYILAMKTEIDKIQQEVLDGSFCDHITKAISSENFMDSYSFNKKIEEDDIIIKDSNFNKVSTML